MNFSIDTAQGYKYNYPTKEEQEHEHDRFSDQSGAMIGSASSNKSFLYECAPAAPATALSLATDRTASFEGGVQTIEKEHMFDKVVTPSDVGKLNRLVIPKQHAEKYFPLNSAANEKGLLLNFEDRNGKPWRFRYSYWNSSQSYVMTKGWSRFVKEKKLDAGDIVSFQRGVGEENRHRLFIDWRRRPSVSAHLEFQNQFNVRWGNRLLYSLPHLQHHPTPFNYPFAPYAPPLQFYARNTAPYWVKPSADPAPIVLDSVPVVQTRAAPGKRLRLFGVNMDCHVAPTPEAESGKVPLGELASGSSSLELRLPSGGGIPMSTVQSLELSKKGKISLSFDLDL